MWLTEKEIRMKNKDILDLTIKKEKEKLQKLVDSKQYNDANSKSGYILGLEEFASSDDFDIKGSETFTNQQIETYLESNLYGDVAFLEAVLSGYEVAKNITQ